MARKFLNRVQTITTSFVPLSERPIEANVDISCPTGNAGNVTFQADNGGTDVEWEAGEWHRFKAIDLADIRVKGTAGDTVTIIGDAG